MKGFIGSANIDTTPGSACPALLPVMFATLARMWCQRPMRTWNWLIWSCWWGPIQHGAIPLSISASWPRSEEHTSEFQSLIRKSYDVFCLIIKTDPYDHKIAKESVQTQNTNDY